MEKLDYLEAARILATCPERRLPQVVKMLREAGFKIEDGFVRESREVAKDRKRKRMREKRMEGRTFDFRTLGDDFLDTLRDAFEKGINISDLSRTSGMGRTTLYRYLKGETYPSKEDRERILDAISEIAGRDS